MELWDNFCPLFEWVAPESGTQTGNGYLKKHWNRATSIHAINFRQFAFLSTDFKIDGTGRKFLNLTVTVRAGHFDQRALKSNFKARKTVKLSKYHTLKIGR